MKRLYDARYIPRDLNSPQAPDVPKPEVRYEYRRKRETTIREPNPSPSHPFAHLAGKYNDEPLWDEFLKVVEEYRQEVNERESSVE